MDIILQKIEAYSSKDNKKYARVAMFADSTDVALPETGETVQGLGDEYYIAPGSSIFTADGNVIFRGINGWGEWL